MPMDFLLYPEKAYYLLGGEMPVCRLVTGTWQVDGRHGYHPLFLDVKVAARAMVREHGYTTFDVAPFYGQMERWLGEVRMKIEDPAELDAYKVRGVVGCPPASCVPCEDGRLQGMRGGSSSSSIFGNSVHNGSLSTPHGRGTCPSASSVAALNPSPPSPPHRSSRRYPSPRPKTSSGSRTWKQW